ncbi:grasp-with-spasm system ATP-grasp peptide maturase [Mucilaginibacter paludis]|uniref:ATP-grasp domain-containing protein n=1 Tax=Mucilaginibacter paludis DSM 18603 TaxID=714943 RepID=H1Y1N6_9SPHI|nr:grasp-with-spasm system ATP-grasp peptide maturase [Mucilaginibacter paludis]EHQ24695.1 hypothetical protein Mucpa_0502 [Mucilaginibacter paludis DSM 18603]
MILIISHHNSEFTTELIMDWIHYYGHECKRVNGLDILDKLTFNLKLTNGDGVKVETNSGIEAADIIWFRRWMVLRSLEDHMPVNSNFFLKDIAPLIKSEFDGVTRAFFFALKGKNWDDKPEFLREYPIKIKQLEIAQSVGLKIPNTIITNNKKDLQVFVKTNNIEEIIIKPVKDGTLIGSTEGCYVIYTAKVTKELSEIPELFFPSLFQEAISKIIEIRVFFHKDICYSMAIFSSYDEKTSVDFRNYNFAKPNRYVPYKLPDTVESKIRDFMEILNLKSGSLDILLNTKNEYVFLEVNPVGQFSMVSFPCNYYLERVVANSLISEQITPGN